MGWEVRAGGRRYLYRNRRVNGRPVKEYLACNDPFGFGAVMADDLARLQRREGKVRALRKQARVALRGRIDGLLAEANSVNAVLRIAAEGLLAAVGFHKHNRGEWRMRHELKDIKALVGQLETAIKNRGPLVNYDAPNADAEAVELFAKARAGDAAALEHVRHVIRDRNWMDWLGDLGRQSTRQLIYSAAGGDAVWAAGITEKVNALRQQLLGENPSVLEELLVRRVVNGWVTVHSLELELAVRRPTDPTDRDYLDRALSRAQKRMTQAAGELARVRRLQAPRVFAQLNLAATQTVVNAEGR